MNGKVAASVDGRAINFPTESKPLQRREGMPLCAGLSSFGYSGTIAHVVLEEAPESCRRSFSRVEVSLMSDVPGSCVEIASELAPGTAWQFAGQGSLKVNIGREIFNETESFRSAMLLCDGILFTSMG